MDEKAIRWRCRRGMKELDVMLERFLAHGYPALSQHEKTGFARLLDALDPDLFAWLSGTGTPADVNLAAIVRRIRAVLAAAA